MWRLCHILCVHMCVCPPKDLVVMATLATTFETFGTFGHPLPPKAVKSQLLSYPRMCASVEGGATFVLTSFFLPKDSFCSLALFILDFSLKQLFTLNSYQRTALLLQLKCDLFFWTKWVLTMLAPPSWIPHAFSKCYSGNPTYVQFQNNNSL
jgi:hypothetical protein